jgi:hypothetical protein
MRAALGCTRKTRVQANPGCSYCTPPAVDPGVQDLCKSAVHRLRGLRLCPEGQEDSKITHLVIGKERRTLKLMLAGGRGCPFL